MTNVVRRRSGWAVAFGAISFGIWIAWASTGADWLFLVWFVLFIPTSLLYFPISILLAAIWEVGRLPQSVPIGYAIPIALGGLQGVLLHALLIARLRPARARRMP